MESNELARFAVNLLVKQLTGGGGQQGEFVGQLVAQQLGAQEIALARRNPWDAREQARLADVVTAQLRTDQRFADSLERAVQAVTPTHVTHISGDGSGNRAGGNMTIKNRRFHIGNVQFGMGGLVSSIVVLVVLLGGGSAAVYYNTKKSVDVASAVGRWQQAAGTPISGIDTKPTVLTVSGDGRFTFSTGYKMNIPGGGNFPTDLPVSEVSIDCTGTIEPDGDQFTLRATTGPCGTFSAKPSSDGKVLDVFLQNGSTDGSRALSKVSG
jgi:hypothetical protein